MALPLLIQFALGPLVLVALLWIPAPYGRHGRPGWGPGLPGRVAWTVMEAPALLTIALLTLAAPGGRAPVAWVPLLFWCGHYGYRTLVYPALMRPSQNRFPLALVAGAVAFNLLNGYNNAAALLADARTDAAFPSLHFWLGGVLFAAGFAIHVHADWTIRELRGPGETGYRIPRGGLFRWVASPNYLGEIIMWSGWAVLSWSLAGLAFALFTACNLAPRALANLRWYRRQFPDFPVERRALVPGVL